MKRRWSRGVGVLAPVLVLVLVLGTVRFGRSAMVRAPASVGHAGAGALRAGAARVPLSLPRRAVIGGYPGWHRAQGAGPLFARALALEAGGARAVILALDALLIPPPLRAEVIRRAGLDDACLLFAATHTHSGAGGTWKRLVPELAGNGPYSADEFDAVAAAAARAAREAVQALHPSRASAATVEWPDGPARARSEGPLDARLTALRLDGAGVLVVYGMHPTSVGRGQTLQADWPGEAAARLERDLGLPALVLQGAGGNATWSGAHPGETVALEAERALGAAAELAPALRCASAAVPLPPPEASPRTPWVLRRAATNALALLADDPLATGTRISLGGLTLQGVPGEPVGALGIAARPAVLIGLADGYVGYVETPEHWSAGAGESGRTYFGPQLSRALGL